MVGRRHARRGQQAHSAKESLRIALTRTMRSKTWSVGMQAQKKVRSGEIATLLLCEEELATDEEGPRAGVLEPVP